MRMTFGTRVMKRGWQGLSLGTAALALAGCATTINDDVSKSRLAQPVADEHGQAITAAGDIAIAGQMVSHSIMNLSEVADATVPPLVQFRGVTSVISGPVDTEPYTDLLRDRLLLITREKLRFVERQLPPLHSHKGKHSGEPMDVNTDADYKILAELRGEYGSDTYLVQIQFLDVHSGQILFNGLYSIRREEQDTSPETVTTHQQIESTNPNPEPVDVDAPPPPPPNGNSGLQ
jgi:hypothetical protein